jgi:outer membrane lipoprotein-sorting protein
VLGEELVEGRTLVKLQLTAREQSTRPRQLFLWVDQTFWVVARMESVPYQGGVLRLEFTHGQVGGYTLPQSLKATFESTGRDTTQRPLDIDPDMAGQLGETRQRPSRSGSITVKYLDYKINVGLADEIFEKKESQQKVQ